MDRNSVIGLSLIAVLLVFYFYYFSPSPQPAPVEPAAQRTQPQTIPSSPQASNQPDSATIRSYGSLSTLLTGEEKFTRLENSDLAIDFSSRGVPGTVELKGFKTYQQEKLILINPTDNTFRLLGRNNGTEIDLYKLNYTSSTTRRGDTTLVNFEAQTQDGALIRHVYALPPTGYQVDYRLELKGIDVEGGILSYQWNNNTPLVEKDLNDSRVRTTINYYTLAGDFDGLSESSIDPESETLVEPIKWIAIRQKFFISSIIAKGSFQGAEISTGVNPIDSSHVKQATVKGMIKVADAATGQARYTYYFGPNDLDVTRPVAPSFERNLYLGWPPVVWVNRYLILPIFTFLESFVGNYGLVIFLLVLIIRLLLTPLSYKSYLGMAKMRLLKPELDLIKEKNGDNMAQTQQDQMKLYSQAGVNPFSGCIPLLLQLPVLLSMFYFFPVSIELRQVHFLWAEDLSTYDSILDLPFTIPFYGDHVSLFVLLMTISTLVSTWQNNQLGTVQGPMKSMSYIMPVIFLFVLNNFSAGLSYYYFVSNLLTFAQQAIIRRFVDEEKIKTVMEDHKKKMLTTGAAKGKKSGFMARLEDAMKASEEARKKAGKKKE
jgi:YidC/Oxa1 family membrane protein insertase